METGKGFTCPKCSHKGNNVKIITPLNLLKEESLGRLKSDQTYKFCKTPDCKVAYYSMDADDFFLTEELKVAATVKDSGLNVNVCYCFGYTRQSVLDEIKETGNSTVLEEIKAKMKDPGCFCERSNPQGECCLGNVTEWMEQIKLK